ncbi:hypothetical protein C8R43DRAFT_1170304 [Mycena crocata]|nr:hypothetical protein C8R43DRAFT_1170304 [Mycena crocata]
MTAEALAAPIIMALHPTFHLDRLFQLPVSLRRIAQLAATGSLEHVQLLRRLAKTSSVEQALLFLPAFYANLTPDAIPRPLDVDMDFPSPKVASEVLCAFVSLGALEAYPRLLPELYRVLWPRIWSWMEFLHIHHHSNSAGQIENCAHFMNTICRVRSDVCLAEQIDTTPGVWSMLAQLWILCVDHDLFGRGHYGATVVGSLIRDAASAPRLNEMVEALGGTQIDLATLVVKHIRLLTRESRSSADVLNLTSVVFFVSKAASIGLLSREAFLAADFATVVANATCNLRDVSDYGTPDLMRMGFDLLRWTTFHGPVNKFMPVALKAGLLRVMEPLDVNRIAILENLQKSAISDEWKAFIELATARFAVLESFESNMHASSRACNNCGIIAQKHSFRVCSAGYQSHYCSQVCQQADWNDGGHRDACEFISMQAAEHPEELTRRELLFMRSLIHHEYLQSKHTIWLQQIAFMHGQPATTFYTRFDFARNGTVSVHVCPQEGSESDESEPLNLHSPRNQAVPDQGTGIGGHIELHQMRISLPGAKYATRLFPLRSSSAAVFHRLREMASRMEPGSDLSTQNEQVLAKLRQLDEDAQAWGVVQIHY